MEKDKQKPNKELEVLYNYYYSQAITHLQKPRWNKIYIGVSIFAVFFLLTINHYNLNDTGWIFGYVGCWLISLFLFFLLYFLLPKRWKWIGKPFTKQQKCAKIAYLLEDDIKYSKRTVAELQNELSRNEATLDQRKKLRDLINKNLGE